MVTPKNFCSMFSTNYACVYKNLCFDLCWFFNQTNVYYVQYSLQLSHNSQKHKLLQFYFSKR